MKEPVGCAKRVLIITAAHEGNAREVNLADVPVRRAGVSHWHQLQ
jgi:hypothetical protein